MQDVQKAGTTEELEMSDDTLFWIGFVVVPLIGGLQRFAVSYGYEGNTRHDALGEARGVVIMLYLICGLFAIAKCAGS